MSLSTEEQSQYDNAGRSAGSAKLSLIGEYGYPTNFGQFMAKVQSSSGFRDREGQLAKTFLSNMQIRRKIISQTNAKLRLLPFVAEGINTASSTLVFCETKNASERISNDLDNYGCVLNHIIVNFQIHREEILEDLASKWLIVWLL